MRDSVKIDVSEAVQTCSRLQDILSPAMFHECMRTAIRDAGTREVKRLIKAEVPERYHASKTFVGRKVGKAKMEGPLSCVVPVKSERGVLGGMFPASGGGYSAGTASTKGKAKKKLVHNRRIQAKILKARVSRIPTKLKNQGGHAPFRLPSGIVLTHSASKRLVRVVGRSVPQMVDRLFESKLKEPLNRYIIKRMDQVITAKLDGSWGKKS